MIKKMFSKQPAVVGPVIEVTLPGLDIVEPVAAKVDTGAHSGAIHATRIKEIFDGGGRHWLEFAPLGGDQTVRLEAYREKLVKSSNGYSEKRYVIDTEICIDGTVYPISISLADRSQLRYPILIGRRFLATHKFVIDLARKS